MNYLPSSLLRSAITTSLTGRPHHPTPSQEDQGRAILRLACDVLARRMTSYLQPGRTECQYGERYEEDSEERALDYVACPFLPP
jgi:hypothetical protein